MIAYVISYIASYFAASAGHYVLSGIILILMSFALYAMDYLKTRNVINLRGLFTLGFLGGEGVACLKLSYLETDWHIMTWLCFFFAFTAFYLIYELLMLNKARIDYKIKPLGRVMTFGRIPDVQRLFVCILVLTAVSTACFLFEAVVLGYVPLFVRGVPHAYSYFHISGVHYFTVSCVLVPAFSVIWFLKTENRTPGRTAAMIICDFMAFSIPLLCVSRFQFVFAVALAILTFIAVKKNVSVKLVISAVFLGVAAFAVLSAARSHDAEYLNSIFEMKISLPVSISRIYIYIANNYDNFDCLVRQLTEHTFGLRMLFPVWALTGLKFVAPQLVDFPLYVTKEELTTLTMFYDFYYDFGVLGVFLGSALIGATAVFIERFSMERDDPMAAVFYAQFAIYMILAFFTTWFSNPTTWFYLAVTVIIYFICIGEKEAK
ncbi:MAG: O-antigen polymerase [Lachnospiraceae bacterium]|nr:O-antigen polymerase [Lachnospiraceae bacterium]